MKYQDLIRNEMKYQRERLYKRLKIGNGRLVVEYWAGAKRFLNEVPGIKWQKQGNKILIKENKNMKTFRDIINEAKPDFSKGDKVIFTGGDAKGDGGTIVDVRGSGFVVKSLMSGKEVVAQPDTIKKASDKEIKDIKSGRQKRDLSSRKRGNLS